MNESDKAAVETHNPPGLVFAAVAVGGLGIGFGIAATVLMVKSQANVTAPSATVSAKPLPAPEPAPRSGPWTEQLHAEACPEPCCGGVACRVSAENTGKKACKEGETHCESCSSKLTCIPGACGEGFAGDEELALHLSSVLERGSSGEAIDACKSRRDLWLCVKRPAEDEWQCLSQREACSNQSRSPAAVVVKAAELTRKALEFEVREGGPEGATLAKKNDALYKNGLQRRGLCGGFRGDFEPGPVSAFTFYLDVPAGPEAPGPMRVPAKAARDAGPEAAAAPSAAAAVLSAAPPAASAPASP